VKRPNLTSRAADQVRLAPSTVGHQLADPIVWIMRSPDLSMAFQMIFHTTKCVQVGQLSLKQIKLKIRPNNGIAP
jgi:hypothetical protein